MNNLGKKLLGFGVGTLIFAGILFSPKEGYSQTAQDSIQKSQTEQPTKKVRKFYHDVNFMMNSNIGEGVKDFVSNCFGFGYVFGRRLGDDFKLGISYDMLWGSKKKDNLKNEQKAYHIGLEAIYSPFSRRINEIPVDPLYFGGGVNLNINSFKGEDYFNDESISIFNPGFFIKAGGQINLSKKKNIGRLNIGIIYNYSKTTYNEEKVDLSTFGFFLGASE